MMNLQRRMITLLGLAFLLATAALAGAQSSYNDLVEAYFNFYLGTAPSLATSLGFHEYDGKFEDFSEATHAADQLKLHEYLKEFQAVDRSNLSALERDDVEILIHSIQANLLEEERIQQWRRNPDTYSSACTGSIYALIKRNFAPVEDRMRSVISREARIPAALKTASKLLQNPPKIYTEIAIQQLPGIIGFFQSTVPDAFKDVKDALLIAQFQKNNAAVIAALTEYQSFLQKDLLPRSNGTFAIGAENYRLKVSYEEMVDIPLDRLLQIGYAQLHKDQKAFEETAKLIDPSKSADEVKATIVKDHPGATELIPAAQKMLDGLRQFLIDHKIITVPGGAQAKVIETPPFARAVTFASMDTPGPYETKATEAYYNITLPDPSWTAEKKEDYLRGYNYPLLSNVNVHEVWPGHYTQFLWVKNNPELSKVRKLTGSGSNAEGWAHYSEEMILDEGFGNHDPKLRMGQLVDALLRDARFIVGIQMHTKGMTMEQAQEFFVHDGHQQPAIGEMETKRGTADPTYLVYTLGKLEILKLREDYRKKMGDKFSLQEFHDRFIKCGAPPIKIVRREMLGEDSPVL